MMYPLTALRRESVRDALARITGKPVAILEERSVGRPWAPVTRLVVDTDLPDGGRSVIVKTRRVEGSGFGGDAFLRREVAALTTAAAAGIVPHVLHFDDPAGIVLLSDLGEHPTLQDLLLGADPEVAAAGVLDLAVALGRLQAATAGRLHEHETLLGGYRADVEDGLTYEATDVLQSAVAQACERFGFPSPSAVGDDIAALFERIAAPRPFAALSHRDLNPTNVLLTPVGARLIDFENAAFGHPGVDVCFLTIPFPHHSDPWGLLPDDLGASAEAAYRVALTERGLAASADELDRQLADATTFVVILRLTRMERIVSDDQSADDAWRRRGQMIHQLGAACEVAARDDALRGLATWMHALATAMAERWPNEAARPAPLFPAFTSGLG